MLRSMVTLVCFVLLVTACGGGSSDQPEAAQDTSSPESASRVSPMHDAFGFDSEPSSRQFQLITEQRKANAAIVSCMSDAGFFYAVDDVQGRLGTVADLGDGSREWIEQNGLGVASSFVDVLSPAEPQDAAVRNLDFVAGLSALEAASYDLALVGEVQPASATAEYQPGGCWATSYGTLVEQLSLVSEFESELELLNNRLLADPRTRDFQADWSACMNGVGFRYDNETAMTDDLYARLLDVELVDNNGVATVASPELLDELIEYEKQVGVASFDCRASFAEELTNLRYDYELEFLEDNRFRIADLLPKEPGN